ncbi:MAG: hypothetical protein ACLGI8_08350 [Acidimicrobiia bacterium]
MIKRSFRFGLLVGLLGGLALALVKAFSGRDEEPAVAPAAPSPPWPRLDADPAIPAKPQERLVADPDAPVRPAPDPTPVSGPAAMAPAPPATEPAHPQLVAEAAPAPRSSAQGPEAGTGAEADRKATKPPKKTAKKASRKQAAPPRAWVEPQGDVCPPGHPVKAKLASKIFHVPGGLSYARTRPDRCYRDAAAAEADDLRRAKR